MNSASVAHWHHCRRPWLDWEDRMGAANPIRPTAGTTNARVTADGVPQSPGNPARRSGDAEPAGLLARGSLHSPCLPGSLQWRHLGSCSPLTVAGAAADSPSDRRVTAFPFHPLRETGSGTDPSNFANRAPLTKTRFVMLLHYIWQAQQIPAHPADAQQQDRKQGFRETGGGGRA